MSSQVAHGGKFNDKTGMRFGKVTVLRFNGMRKGYSFWDCECECGNIITVNTTTLSHRRVGCGCTRGRKNVSHGESRGGRLSPEYSTYLGMLARCRNSNHKAFYLYGGRGIKVYAKWIGKKGFAAFLSHMGRKPTINHTIERIDSDEGYKPGNVKWATRREQGRNTRRNVMLTFNGEVACLSALAERYGVKYMTAYHRLRRGFPMAKVFAPL